jgi:N-acetylglutamate synthase-like GNAT family acetyltransferase
LCEVATTKSHQSKSFIDIEALNNDKQVIGKASLSKIKTDKNLLWLHELEVHPLCRRKGVGTALMDHIVELGEKKGVELVYACPVPLADAEGKAPSEKQLKAFYRKQGFQPCKAPKDIVTVTDEGLQKRGMCLKL